jgi:hypothetical protein
MKLAPRAAIDHGSPAVTEIMDGVGVRQGPPASRWTGLPKRYGPFGIRL